MYLNKCFFFFLDGRTAFFISILFWHFRLVFPIHLLIIIIVVIINFIIIYITGITINLYLVTSKPHAV